MPVGIILPIDETPIRTLDLPKDYMKIMETWRDTLPNSDFSHGVVLQRAASIEFDDPNKYYTLSIFAAPNYKKDLNLLNIHELPDALGTKMYFGPLIMVLSRNNITTDLTIKMYHDIIKNDTGINRQCTRNSKRQPGEYNGSESDEESDDEDDEYEECDDNDDNDDDDHNEEATGLLTDDEDDNDDDDLEEGVIMEDDDDD